MRIDGVNTAGYTGQTQGSRPMQEADAYSKSLQKQIDEAQKQLQELSGKTDMTAEEKMQKRQELQKQITDLTNLLRQHEIELRKEKQQEAARSMDEMLGGKKEEEAAKQEKNGGLSTGRMEAMLSADAAKGQAQVLGGVATQLKAMENTLRGEIKQDGARGSDVSAKQEELARVQTASERAVSSQLGKLKEAGETLEESAEREAEAKRTQKNQEEDRTEEQKEENAEAAGLLKDREETPDTKQPYVSVDILL